MNEQRPTNPNQFQTPYAANPTAPAGQVVRPVGATPSALGVKPDARLANAFLSQAFLWMFAGLLLTAGIAYVVQSNPKLLEFAEGNFFLLFIAQLAIVMVIAGAINLISASTALALFFVYAAAVYGKVTQRSLAKLGGILFMGLIGLFVAMILNIFLGSTQITWLISIVGVVLFTALTAYDVQRIQSGDIAAQTGSMEKAAVIGALQLYLDFINLFLFMLRLMGGRS